MFVSIIAAHPHYATARRLTQYQTQHQTHPFRKMTRIVQDCSLVIIIRITFEPRVNVVGIETARVLGGPGFVASPTLSTRMRQRGLKSLIRSYPSKWHRQLRSGSTSCLTDSWTALFFFFFFAKNAECEGKVSPGKLYRRRHCNSPMDWATGPTRTARRHGQQNMPTQHSNGECMPLGPCPANTRGDSRASALAKTG